MDEEELEKAMLKSAENFGAAENIWVPDYGWILRDGEPTEEGLRLYKELIEEEKGS